MTYKKTVDKLLDDTMALMGEPAKYKKEYEEYAVENVNQLISDLFIINNAQRQRVGKAPLGLHPVMMKVEDEIPYEYEMLNDMMPYGLAYRLFMHDDENGKAMAMNEEYESRKKNKSVARYVDIVPVRL